MKLNDKCLTPLYQQVLEDIKAQISAGTYPPGSKIPSEAELSDMYSVSRVTVRRAIEELVGEGYLTSRQGKGTFVNQRKVTRKIRQSSDVKSFSAVCADEGMRAGARLIERLLVPMSADAKSLFGEGSESAEGLVYVSRVRTADGVPIMIENNYFLASDFSFLLDESVQVEDVSIFGLIREHTGRYPASCSLSTIEIALASTRMAGVLDINPGDPLFYEHVFFLDQDGKPLCMSNKYLVGSRYLFEF